MPKLLVLTLLVLIILFKNPATIGYVAAAGAFNFTDKVDLIFNQSDAYTWDLQNSGELLSVRLNGKAKSNGFVRVYLEHGNSTYLIFDNKELQKTGSDMITGYAVKEGKHKKENEEPLVNETKTNETITNETILINQTTENEIINLTALFNESINITPLNETINVTIPINESINLTPVMNETIVNETINSTMPINKSIAIELEYNKNTTFDENDDGFENVDGVIDLTIENTKFNWQVNEEKLCTRWEIYNVDEEALTTLCNGNDECCAFIGLLPSKDNWKEEYYSTFGKDGAGYSNIISAQVIYYDVNLSIETPKSDISYSEWQNLTAKFDEEFIEFGNICMETCILPNLNGTSYRLLLEIENSSIILDSISYELLINATANTAPFLIKNFSNISILNGEAYAISLNEYFYDEDNDTLTFSYYNNSEIDVAIVNGTATLIPASGFTGVSYMFFAANDSAYVATSNVFEVEVKERKLKSFVGNGLKSLRQIIGLI